MNELDNWYKNNINNQQIPPYQESYWQAASAFIARAEKLRKLKLIERGMSVFLLVLTSILLLGYADTNDGEKAKATPAPIAMLEDSANESTSVIEDNSGSERNRDFTSPATVNDTKSPSRVQRASSSTSKVENRAKSSPGKYVKNTESNISKSIPEEISIAKAADADPKLESSVEIANTPKDVKSALPLAEEKNTEIVSESEELITEMMAVQFLPYPDILLLKEETQFELKPFEVGENTVTAVSESNKPYFRKSLSIGLPFSVNSGVDGGKWMGGNLSLQAEYHLNAHWMVSAGLGYAMRKGPVGIIHDHPISEYSFEMRDRGHWMTIDELHYVSIPISINYKFNKFVAGVGYRPMGLASARAVVSSYDHHRTYDDQGVVVHTETRNEQIGWAKPSGLRTFTHEFTGQLSYQIAPHWRVMASLAYNPLGNTDEGFGLKYNDVTGDYQKAYQVSRPFQAEALFAEISIQYIW